jgi:hypothetical protein
MLRASSHLRSREGTRLAAVRLIHQIRPRLSERLLATLDRVGPHLRGAIYDLRLEREQDRPFDVLLEELVELQRTMVPQLEIALDIQEE